MLSKYIITDATGFLASHEENYEVHNQFKKDGYLLLSPHTDDSGDFDVAKTSMWVSSEEVRRFMTLVSEEIVDTIWLVVSVAIKGLSVETKILYACASQQVAEDLADNEAGHISIVAQELTY